MRVNRARDNIETLLAEARDNDQKTISITLEAVKVEAIDRIAAGLSKIGSATYSRNTVFKLALDSFIDEAEEHLKSKYGIDVRDEEMGVRKEKKPDDEAFDVLILPAHDEGFREVFLGEGRWYPFRINAYKIPKVKYIAIYRGVPISAITHYARVKEISSYLQEEGKYQAVLDGEPYELTQPITLEGMSAAAFRSPRYTTLDKLTKARTAYDLFDVLD